MNSVRSIFFLILKTHTHNQRKRTSLHSVVRLQVIRVLIFVFILFSISQFFSVKMLLFCPQTPPAAGRALQTNAAARSNPALGPGHKENQPARLTTLNQSRPLAQAPKAGLPPSAEISQHAATDRSAMPQAAKPSLRAPTWGCPVQTTPFTPKGLSWTILFPQKAHHLFLLSPALQPIPFFLRPRWQTQGS